MAATAKKDTGVVEVPDIDIARVNVRIVGMSELVMHAWSEKAKKAMLDKQMGGPAKKREFKDPKQDYEEAFYRLPDGRPCFPSIAFKAAIVSAARQVDGLPMTFLRGALHIDGEFVPIEGEPRMREDTVRVGNGTADLRYRPGFPEWSATLPIRLNRRALKLQQLLSLINQAGFSVGVGEFRPEKDGAWGMFRVDNVEVEEGQQ
jgi:hypothetical protein